MELGEVGYTKVKVFVSYSEHQRMKVIEKVDFVGVMGPCTEVGVGGLVVRNLLVEVGNFR